MKEVLNNDALWEKAKREVFADKKEKYEIEITETLQMRVIVEAKSKEEAKALVENAYYSEKIVLNADNSNVFVEFSHGLYDEETDMDTEYLICNKDGQFQWIFPNDDKED